MNIAIIYRTHIWNDEIASTFEYMRKSLPNTDVFLSYDSKSCTPTIDYDKIHVYSEDTIRSRNWNDTKPDGPEYGNLIWYRGDISVVDFSLLHPQYDFIWNIDYDVTYTDWNDFVTITKQNLENVDFSSCDMSDSNMFPLWGRWGQQSTNYLPVIAGYFAFFGLSKRACTALNELYKVHHGYCEVITPTLIHYNNMVCKDVKHVYPNYVQFKHKNITPFGRYTDHIWHVAYGLTPEKINKVKDWIKTTSPEINCDELSTIDMVRHIYFNYSGHWENWSKNHLQSKN